MYSIALPNLKNNIQAHIQDAIYQVTPKYKECITFSVQIPVVVFWHFNHNQQVEHSDPYHRLGGRQTFLLI